MKIKEETVRIFFCGFLIKPEKMVEGEITRETAFLCFVEMQFDKLTKLSVFLCDYMKSTMRKAAFPRKIFKRFSQKALIKNH